MARIGRVFRWRDRYIDKSSRLFILFEEPIFPSLSTELINATKRISHIPASVNLS